MDPVAEELAAGGFVAAEEEAAELTAAAAGDDARLRAMVGRRLTGEPLAWITGTATFCGRVITVTPGVYVPRWHSEALALRAADLLCDHGVAVDVCTGSGAIARVLGDLHPGARVVATDRDPLAVACARTNGVEALAGDLLDPVPDDLAGRVEVIVGVVPYVPTPALGYLQRDTFTFETALAYDGGPDGTDVARRVIADAPRLLRPGGALVLELGGDQAGAVQPDLTAAGFGSVSVLTDEEGDVRGVVAVLP